MGFRADLDKKVTDIRNWAVKRLFEEEGYFAELSSGEQNADIDWFHRYIMKEGSRELTVERYAQGPGIVSEYSYDNNDEWVAREGTAVWNQKFDELSWVVDTFAGYGKARLAPPRQLHSLAQEVPPQLQGEYSWLTESSGLEKLEDNPNAPSGMLNAVLLDEGIAEMGHWDGAAATAFEATFGVAGEHWREVVQSNYYGAQALVGGMEAHQAVIIAGRHDVLNIADQTLDMLKTNGGNGGGNSYSLLLTIVGAVVGVVLTPVGGFGPAMISAGFAVAGGVLSEAEGAAEKKEIQLGGATVETILDSMSTAATDLTTEIGNAESEVSESLTNLYNSVLGGEQARFVIGYGNTELDDVTVGELGNRTVEGQMDNLERAAKTSFPAAAGRVLAANAALKVTGDNQSYAFVSDVTGRVNGIREPWVALRDLFQDYTATNGRRVAETGQALLEYAKSATDVDYSGAENVYATAEFVDSGTDHQPL